MDIFNIDEIIYNLASIVNYEELHHLKNINKSYNRIADKVIKQYEYQKILKELNMKIVLSSYKGQLTTLIPIEYFGNYKEIRYNTSHISIYSSGFIDITCNKQPSIEEVLNYLDKIYNINIKNMTCVTNTITFNLDFTREKYNELEEIISDRSYSNNLKIKIINNIKFQIGKNGFITGCYKDFNLFMIAYKDLRSLLPKADLSILK